MEKFEQLEQEFSRGKEEIKNDERLSEFGKKEALKDLTANYLKLFRQELEAVDEIEKQLKEQIEKLEKATPKTTLTEAELLAEQREVDLLLSRLAAAGKPDFLRVAEEEATKRPGAFKVAFHKVLDVAERYFPGPDTVGDYDPFDPVALELAGNIDLDKSKRPFIFSQLQSFYDRAVKATISPEELKRQEEIDILKKQLGQTFVQGMRIKRTIERSEQDIAPTFEEVTAIYLR